MRRTRRMSAFAGHLGNTIDRALSIAQHTPTHGHLEPCTSHDLALFDMRHSGGGPAFLSTRSRAAKTSRLPRGAGRHRAHGLARPDELHQGGADVTTRSTTA